jgi:iron(III) transport system ATP-binding protein
VVLGEADPAADQARERYLYLERITKRFGQFTALRDVSLGVSRGEFLVVLGPSGCGKTTLLRIVAGLERQASGLIWQSGREISALPPSRRDYGIVFQSYALFPNLTVFKNVAYGLESRRLGRAEIARRVGELLELVGLPDAPDKFPAQLSGGQQQRVAVARAIATSPGLLLLDEPLSALDARVRVHLRHELKDLQRRLGITTIMVTHDQGEALTLADRIVVMNHGAIEQIGTPLEIYQAPRTAFVADFVGTMNFLAASVAAPDRVRLGQLTLDCDAGGNGVGQPVTVAVRAEDIRVRDVDVSTPNGFPARVDMLEFLGSYCRASLSADALAGVRLTADFPIDAVRDLAIRQADTRWVALPAPLIRVFTPVAGIRPRG